jgi:hypothetical protein
VLDDLLTQPDAALPQGLAQCPRIDHAGDVAPMLRSAGLAVLLAALPEGLLRRIMLAATGAVAAPSMTTDLAASLTARGRALGQQRVRQRSAETAAAC